MDGLKNIGNSILGYFGMSLDNFKLEQGPNGGYNVSFKQWFLTFWHIYLYNKWTLYAIIWK